MDVNATKRDWLEIYGLKSSNFNRNYFHVPTDIRIGTYVGIYIQIAHIYIGVLVSRKFLLYIEIPIDINYRNNLLPFQAPPQYSPSILHYTYTIHKQYTIYTSLYS